MIRRENRLKLFDVYPVLVVIPIDQREFLQLLQRTKNTQDALEIQGVFASQREFFQEWKLCCEFPVIVFQFVHRPLTQLHVKNTDAFQIVEEKVEIAEIFQFNGQVFDRVIGKEIQMLQLNAEETGQLTSSELNWTSIEEILFADEGWCFQMMLTDEIDRQTLDLWTEKVRQSVALFVDFQNVEQTQRRQIGEKGKHVSLLRSLKLMVIESQMRQFSSHSRKNVLTDEIEQRIAKVMNGGEVSTFDEQINETI